MKEKGREQGRKVVLLAAALVIVALTYVISFFVEEDAEPVGVESESVSTESISMAAEPTNAEPDFVSEQWNEAEELTNVAIAGNRICEVENPVSIVSYTYADAGMELQIPDGWEYEIEAYQPDGYTFGISFWPEDAAEGKIRLLNYTNVFGVCGTGLVTEEITLENGMKASVGTYDNNDVWSHLIYQDTEGSYAALTQNVNSWWTDYEDETMKILGNVKLGTETHLGTEMQSGEETKPETEIQ